ncbi:MAG: hypothetical protein Ta2E_10850 [Mycoplasmoidaceae bacterium]|nr:MAG: hypothetical protein Ta2E_10850 [Mycoplasmoidaceae bacterium]
MAAWKYSFKAEHSNHNNNDGSSDSGCSSTTKRRGVKFLGALAQCLVWPSSESYKGLKASFEIGDDHLNWGVITGISFQRWDLPTSEFASLKERVVWNQESAIETLGCSELCSPPIMGVGLVKGLHKKNKLNISFVF